MTGSNQLHEAVQALIDYKRNLQITVYSGHLLKEHLGSDCDDFLAQNSSLWLAQYASESSISWPRGTYPQWSLWQYSESGTIPGIDDNYVDLNNFNGSAVEFLKWISAASGAPIPPEPPTPSETVNVAITAPENVAVQVSVNGSSSIARRRHRILRPAKRGPDILR